MDWLGVRSLPFLTRRNYYYELKHTLLWSTLAGLVDGQFAAVVVSRSFHGSDRLIAVASAMPTAANLLSIFWGLLCVGRPKIQLATIFVGATALLAGAAGAVPTTDWGGVWFVGQVAAAQVMLGGVVTVRSAIWKSNYPRAERGRITARLQGVRFVISVATALLAGRLGDHNPEAYRYVFPAAGMLGALSLWYLSRIHIRGERSEFRRQGFSLSDGDLGSRMLEPYSLAALISPGHVFGQMFRVLREDRRFLRYCVAQFFNGMANLLTISVVVAVVSRELLGDDERGYWISIALVEALPRLVMLGSLSRWGRIFDRLGVLGMRTLNMLCWTMSIVFAMLADFVLPSTGSAGPGVFLMGVGLFTLRAFANGLGQGGGALAWHIGHLHFARPEEAEVYMGIHVSLTGVRGLIAPLGGMWLWRSVGWPMWALAIACSLYSFYVFSSMAREEKRSTDVHGDGSGVGPEQGRPSL